MIAASETSTSTADAGKLILRLALGVLVLLHGIAKITSASAFAFVTSAVTTAGLPASVAYLVYIGEVLAPVLLLLGLWTRVAAVIVAIDVIVAVLLVKPGLIFALAKTGGWALELEGMFFFAAVAVALLGAGRLSLSGSSRWN